MMLSLNTRSSVELLLSAPELEAKTGKPTLTLLYHSLLFLPGLSYNTAAVLQELMHASGQLALCKIKQLWSSICLRLGSQNNKTSHQSMRDRRCGV